MKIVIPIWEFWSTGGTRVLTKLANEFVRKGHDVLVICPSDSYEPYFPIKCKVEYVDAKGNIAKREKKETPKSALKKIMRIGNKIAGLKRALNRVSKNYDIVIANYSLTAYAVYKCKIQNKYYYIQAYEAWENQQKSIMSRLLDLFIRYTYKLDLIRIVNADIYLNYKEIKSDYVVPPGLDLKLYFPKKKFWNKKDKFIVGCIGRKEKWKGSQDVADAVNILYDKKINIGFKVAFNDVNCKKYELVHPHGDNNLADFYRSVDVLVAPGILQLGAIHYPVIEAMACGTPVITTGYYPANSKNSYIVPISSPQTIAKKIEEIINNYDDAMNKVSIALNDIKEFDWDITSEKMLNIIRDTRKEK